MLLYPTLPGIDKLYIRVSQINIQEELLNTYVIHLTLAGIDKAYYRQIILSLMGRASGYYKLNMLLYLICQAEMKYMIDR